MFGAINALVFQFPRRHLRELIEFLGGVIRRLARLKMRTALS